MDIVETVGKTWMGSLDWMVIKYQYYFSDSDDCIVITWEDIFILRKYKLNYWDMRVHSLGKLFLIGLGENFFALFLQSFINSEIIST